MRTPKKIKNGLECCKNGECEDCRYIDGSGSWSCVGRLIKDVFAYIQQLEEKTIPKKCTHEATLHRDLTCPVCKNVVSHTVEIFGNKLEAITDYCPFCGQRITTEETENRVERSSEIWADALSEDGD